MPFMYSTFYRNDNKRFPNIWIKEITENVVILQNLSEICVLSHSFDIQNYPRNEIIEYFLSSVCFFLYFFTFLLKVIKTIIEYKYVKLSRSKQINGIDKISHSGIGISWLCFIRFFLLIFCCYIVPSLLVKSTV